MLEEEERKKEFGTPLIPFSFPHLRGISSNKIILTLSQAWEQKNRFKIGAKWYNSFNFKMIKEGFSYEEKTTKQR